MKKLLVVCGPTATGKTKLAVKLAKKFDGELVSADSRQIYKGMDIGTGKDIGRARFVPEGGYYKDGKVKLWLYDVIAPDQRFSVADYYNLAWKVIKDIQKRGKLPIIVGGTGFYIRAVLKGVGTMGIPPDYKLREKLEEKPLLYLQKELAKVNPQRWSFLNNSDRNNKRRLLRAIEVSKDKKQRVKKTEIQNDVLLIGLRTAKKALRERIDKRVEKRVKQGIVKEIESLLDRGYSWDLAALSGLGYRQWREYFSQKETLEEAVEKWRLAEYRYAKRQLTWFKKEKGINWFDIGTSGFEKEIFAKVGKWHIIKAYDQQG